MRLIRWSRRSLLTSLILVPLPVSSARALEYTVVERTAVERTLFTWSGTVDREVVIVMRGRNVETRASGLDASFAPRFNVNEPMPRSPGEIRAWLEDGRGEVEVLEQPSPRNDFTVTVRVRDTRAGADRYRVIVAWEALGNQGGYRGSDRGRDDADRARGSDRGNDRGGDGGSDRGGDRSGERGGDRGGDRNDHRWYDHDRRDAGAVRWTGLVDDVAEIRIQGRRVEYFTRSGAPLRNVHYDLFGAPLPRRDVAVEVNYEAGRGDVRVVQQPSQWNGFTAVIRINDSRSGYGAYDLGVRW
jgi:hypothetical protein